jgi:hypothetical protein
VRDKAASLALARTSEAASPASASMMGRSLRYVVSERMRSATAFSLAASRPASAKENEPAARDAAQRASATAIHCPVKPDAPKSVMSTAAIAGGVRASELRPL